MSTAQSTASYADVGGGITLKASAPGLTDGSVTIETGAKANQ